MSIHFGVILRSFFWTCNKVYARITVSHKERKRTMPQREEMLTAQEAIRAFMAAGLSEPTFRRRVRRGLIRGELPEGRQRGALYPSSQVYATIEGEKAKSGGRRKKHRDLMKPTTFMKAVVEDMSEIAQVLNAAFGGYPNIERWSSWIQRNPDVGYVVRCEGRIVGCGFILPHTQEKIYSILQQEVTPPTFPEDILLYDTNVPVCLYVRSVAIFSEKDTSSAQRKRWGEILMLGLVNVVIRLGERGLVVTTIYGRSDTRMGERVMRTIGFTQLPTVTSHKNFMIDVATSGLAPILRYKKALATWQQKHSGE